MTAYLAVWLGGAPVDLPMFYGRKWWAMGTCGMAPGKITPCIFVGMSRRHRKFPERDGSAGWFWTDQLGIPRVSRQEEITSHSSIVT